MTLEENKPSTNSVTDTEGNSAQYTDDNRGIGENAKESEEPSGPSKELTNLVLREMWNTKKASTGEIADSVGYSQKQTKKALDWLREKEIVSQEKFTRKKSWVLEQDKLTQELVDAVENELNSAETIDCYLMKLNLRKFGKDSRADRFTDGDGEPEPPSFVNDPNNRT